MTEPAPPAAAPNVPADPGAQPLLGPSGPGRPPHRPSPGRARAFRQGQTQRRALRVDRVAAAVLAGLCVFGAYAIATEHPGFLVSAGSSSTNGNARSTVHVQLGAPSKSTVTCAGGGTAYVETVPWVNSTEVLASSQVLVRLYEIWDGDNIPDPGAVANATASNVCEGVPPDSTAIWYVVLAAPNGTNLLTYTEVGGWASVSGGSSDIVIQDGSSLVVVTGQPISGTGRGLDVAGFAGLAEISGMAPL